MDIRKIKKLIEIIEESDIAEIEISEGEESVRISRYSSNFPAPITVATAPAAPVVAALAPAIGTPAAETPTETVSGHVVKSPMVGTVQPPQQQVHLLSLSVKP